MDKRKMQKVLVLCCFLLVNTISAQVIAEVEDARVEQLRKGFKANKFFKDVFKFATFYGAYSERDAIQGKPTYSVSQDNVLTETTIVNPADYSIVYGFRKLAHFSYEDKKNRGYDGTESPMGARANTGATKNLEYQFEYSRGRQQNREFENSYAFVRYLRDYWFVKGEYAKNELIDLDYISGEVRFRLPIGKKKRLSFSVGSIYRNYQKAYGYSPITSYLENNMWWNLPYNEFGFTDQFYQMTNPFTNESMGYDYLWFDAEGNQVASTDAEFRNVIMGSLINEYNRRELAKIDPLADVSLILGIDYYFYRKNYYLHFFGNVLPYHKTIQGEDQYSYNEYVGKDDWIDYSYGIITGIKLGKHIGVFGEITSQRYWDRERTNLQLGVNFQI